MRVFGRTRMDVGEDADQVSASEANDEDDDVWTNNEPELVDVEAFGRRFRDLLPGLAEELVTLEKEGAIYARFWHEPTRRFRDYRIRLRPAEIVQHVDACVGQQEYDAVRRGGGTFEDGVAAISDPKVRERVLTYESQTIERGGERFILDVRGCQASFMPRELEDLECGRMPDRYERLPDLGDDRSRLAIVRAVLTTFPIIARHLSERGRGRPPILIETEYDIQDIVFAILRPTFPDVRYEDWTPRVAGRSRRIDLVVPDLNVVIELKFVRDRRHGRSVVDELHIDIETYHSHPNCGRLLAFIFDPGNFIVDPGLLERELSGLRVKQEHQFEVEVIVGH
jgi:hypothetical protein